jgi:hypothetical protein
MKMTVTRAAVIGMGLSVLALSAFAQSFPGGNGGRPPEVPTNFFGGQNNLPGAQPSLGMFPGMVQPEELTLARQAADLVRQLGEAKNDNDRDKLKAKLSEVLEKQFDLRQKRHASEIEALKAKVKKLEELVEKRKENRKEIVSKRLDQLQREAQGLGW